MQFSTILAAFAATGSLVSAANFFVTDFSAEHVPHSSASEVSFDLYDGYNGLSTSCSASHTTKFANNLGNYQNTTCKNPALTFTLLKLTSGADAGRYQLALNFGRGHGSYLFQKSQDKYFESPPNSGFTWEYLDAHNFSFPVKV